MGVDIRRSICEQLVAKGKMNGAAFETIAEVGIEALELIDCAEITQDQLAIALEALIPAGLRALLLNHAGRCFGAKAVHSIVSSPKNSLFALLIGGAYMLKDADAAALIEATASSLSSIQFKACPAIGGLLCNSIRDNFGGNCNGHLLELLLEDIPLKKEFLLNLSSSDALSNLKSLTLKQVGGIDDDVVSVLLSLTSNLEGIDLSNNIALTDTALLSIRRSNIKNSLRALQLSGLKSLTAAGLETFFTADISGLINPPKLKKLDLSNCNYEAVNDTVVELAINASASTGNNPDCKFGSIIKPEELMKNALTRGFGGFVHA